MQCDERMPYPYGVLGGCKRGKMSRLMDSDSETLRLNERKTDKKILAKPRDTFDQCELQKNGIYVEMTKHENPIKYIFQSIPISYFREFQVNRHY